MKYQQGGKLALFFHSEGKAARKKNTIGRERGCYYYYWESAFLEKNKDKQMLHQKRGL